MNNHSFLLTGEVGIEIFSLPTLFQNISTINYYLSLSFIPPSFYTHSRTDTQTHTHVCMREVF